MERDIAQVDVLVGLARIVGEDRDDLHRQFAAAPAVEEIDEAMIETRDQHGDALFFVGATHRPRHRKSFRDRGERGAHRLGVGGGSRAVEGDAHEEDSGLGVVELLRVEDVEPALEQRRRNRGDNARPIGAGQREDVARRGHFWSPGKAAARRC